MLKLLWICTPFSNFLVVICKLKENVFFSRICMYYILQQSQMYKNIVEHLVLPYFILPAHNYTQCNNLHQFNIFVTINEEILKESYQLSIVCTAVNFLLCTIQFIFERCIIPYICPYSDTQNDFTALKIPCIYSIHTFPISQKPLIFDCPYSLAFSCV